MKNKFDAILPCRMTSTRLYGKPLQHIDIKNKITIIEYLVNYLKTSKYLDKVIIAIADSKGNDILAEYAMKNNWEFIFGDENGGPWSGILSYDPDSSAFGTLLEGFKVIATGYIAEYSTGAANMTELFITQPVQIISFVKIVLQEHLNLKKLLKNQKIKIIRNVTCKKIYRIITMSSVEKLI